MNTKMKTVLVIDDEAEMREILVQALRSTLTQVIEAKDGKEGLELIQSVKPDVVVSDYMMPGLNGLQLLEEMKKLGLITPVVWLTGLGTQELFRNAWRTGVYDFFEKPADLGQLIESVGTALAFGAEFNIHRRPGFMERSSYEDVKLSLDKEVYERLVESCRSRGVSIHSALNEVLAEHHSKKAS